MESQKVLVVGGAGYVGAHICKELSRNGYVPIVYDNLCRGHRESVQWGPLIEGDILDLAVLTQALRETAPCAVMHFAAFAYVGESNQKPLMYYRNNVVGTLNLMQAMADVGVDKLIFSSTCAIYGDPGAKFLSEDLPKNPINPYGRTKLVIEQALEDIARTGALNYVALRYFNAAGDDAEGVIGEIHNPETHLIPLAIESCMGGPVLSILGTDYSTPDGTAVRDYTHVTDLAAAHVLALKYLLNDGVSDCFNLGSGCGYSVRQIVDALRTLGVAVETIEAPRRPGDPPQLVADITKVSQTLGWTPVHSSLENILSTAYRWRKQIESREKKSS